MRRMRQICFVAIALLIAAQAFASDKMFMAYNVSAQTMQAVVQSNTSFRAMVTFTQSNPNGYIGSTTLDQVESSETWAEAIIRPSASDNAPGISGGAHNVITATAQLFNASNELLNTLQATDTLYVEANRDESGLQYGYGNERDVMMPDSVRLNTSFCAHIVHGTYVIPVVCDVHVPGIVDPRSVEVFVMNGCSNPGHCLVDCQPIDWSLFSWHIRSLSNCRIYLTMAYCGADTGCICIWRSDRELPVEMTGFSALAGDSRVLLNWGTGSESNLQEFRITRSEQPNDGYTTVARVNARNSATGANYSWTDNSVANGATYYYKLHVAEVSGHVAVYNINGQDVIAEATPHVGQQVPEVFALEQNYPNPFNSQTSFRFALPAAEHVTLKVFDMLGREVATVVDKNMQPNFYSVNWSADGLAAGLYLYRFTAGEFTQTKKLLYIK